MTLGTYESSTIHIVTVLVDLDEEEFTSEDWLTIYDPLRQDYLIGVHICEEFEE